VVTDVSKTRNPLLFPLIGIGVSAAQALRDLARTQAFDVFGAWSVAAATILLALYVRRSKAAGTFMFWSLVPLYPLYFALTWSGWYGAPARPAVYGILAVVWVVASVFVWRWKRNYERFIGSQAELAPRTDISSGG
jgi:hypothetical protein